MNTKQAIPRRNSAGKRFAAIAGLTLLSLFASMGLYAQAATGDEYSSDDHYWRQALGGAVIGNPVVQAESVVIATDGGSLKSYSSQGTFLWEYYARGRLTPHVSRSMEGTSYICRTNGILIAVNRVGRELWEMSLGSPTIFPVISGWDGRLFIFTDRKITCMTAAGYTLWSMTLEKNSLLAPFRDGSGGIIMILEDGELVSIDPFGNSYSYTPRGKPVAATPIEIEGWGPTVLLIYEDSGIEAVNITMRYGETFSGTPGLSSSPVAAAGRKNEVAILTRDGRLSLLSLGVNSLNERKILWTAASHIRAGEITAQSGRQEQKEQELFYDERGIYVLTKNGGTGFSADGSRLWMIRLRGTATIPAFGDDGILYSGGSDWILYSYQMEDRIKSKKMVLYGHAPEGNYGMGNPGPSSWANQFFRFEGDEMDWRLEEIRRSILNGNVGALEKDYASYLMETAADASTAYLQRMEAIRLLSFIGSRETIPFLANLFTRDKEFLIKSAAAQAIGRIGVDPEGFALQAFQDAILPPSPLTDEQVLSTIAGAAGALCRFSGPPLSSGGVRILTLIASNDRSPVARSRAIRELGGL